MIGRPPGPPGAPGAPAALGPHWLGASPGGSCQVTVGFFTHRVCGQPGAGSCGGCGRSACTDHLRRDLGLCVECAARQREGGVLDDLADDMSFYLYRQGFYRRVYGDRYTGLTFFDEMDRGALDHGNLAQDEAVDADADQASALDS